MALVGPSGSGKSSCISLLEHFYDPAGGKVLIDGVPIQDYEHHFIHNAVRRHCIAVSGLQKCLDLSGRTGTGALCALGGRERRIRTGQLHEDGGGGICKNGQCALVHP